MGERERRLFQLAGVQHGLVTRQQFLDAGYSLRTLQRRVESGVWVSLGRGVFVLHGVPNDLPTRTRALALQAPDGVLTGTSAAVLSGRGPWDRLDLREAQPHIVARPRRGTVPARFVTHPGVGYRNVQGMKVARPQYAVVDLIRFLPPAQAREVAYRAVQTGVTNVGLLTMAAESLVRHAGAPQLREVLLDLRAGVRSEAERWFVSILRRGGISGWIANYPIECADGRSVIVDVAFPHLKLAFEVDGRAHHSDEGAFEWDRERQNAIEQTGWSVRRVTWRAMALSSDRVLAMVRSATELRATELGL